MIGASSAASTMMPSRMAPSRPMRLPATCSTVLSHRLRLPLTGTSKLTATGWSRVADAMRLAASQPDARVEDAVGDVGQQVDGDDHQHQEQQAFLHDHVVAAA